MQRVTLTEGVERGVRHDLCRGVTSTARPCARGGSRGSRALGRGAAPVSMETDVPSSQHSSRWVGRSSSGKVQEEQRQRRNPGLPVPQVPEGNHVSRASASSV